MTGAAWLTMAAVCGFVWGGFALLVGVAFRKERGRRREERGLWVP